MREARGQLAETTQQRDQARARVRRLRARVDRLRAMLASTEADLGNHRETMQHYMLRTAEYEEAIASGKTAQFDYSYELQRRKLDSGSHSFFLDLVAAGEERYVELVARLAGHVEPLSDLSAREVSEKLPYWENTWFPPLDGLTLYSLVTETKPALYVEVGSGFSTKFVRRAIEDHGLNTRVLSIDPFPRAEIDELCDEVMRTRFEDVGEQVLERLQSGDMLFIDNSHRSFTGSDVTVFFTEWLPYLNSGVRWGLHDTFVPADYPQVFRDRFFNEQYLLMCYLLGGAMGDSIELPVAYLAERPHLLEPLLARWPAQAPPLDPILSGGGCFWMRKA